MQQYYFGNNRVIKRNQTFSNSVLQMLNRWIPDEWSGVYFDATAFELTVNSWDNIPVVFAQEHPDPDLFESDPAKALEKVNGVIAGKCSNPRIEKQGHIRLMAALEITDENALTLWQNGELSLSTAFFAMSKMEG